MPLVLSRRIGEPIDVTVPPGGGKLSFQVVDIDRNSVRVSIEAPREITVDRREVTERKIAGSNWPLIEVPDGLAIVADEFCQRWPVIGHGRQRLAYMDTKTHVPNNADLIIEFEPGRQSAAEAFAIRLRARGYTVAGTELVEHRHEIGGEGAAA